MFGLRSSLVRYSKHFMNFRHERSFCNTNKSLQNRQPDAINGQNQVYRDLENLDFSKATNILLNPPHNRKKKKFGFDFHLVQFFFACMPSLAVFLVAKYAQYDERKFAAQMAIRRKAAEEKLAEEEKKAKLLKGAPADEDEPVRNAELLKVKERLEALEETIKEIAVVTEKQSSDDSKSKNADQSQSRVDPNSQSSIQPLKQEDSKNKGSHEDKK